MSRVINLESAGKDRARMVKAVVLAMRELARQTDVGQEARDLTAFLALALKSIFDTIEVSVAAWEKRGYWVKADKFRLEWEWTGIVSKKLCQALTEEDWGKVSQLCVLIGAKFGKITLPVQHRLGRPWTGAYGEFTSKIK